MKTSVSYLLNYTKINSSGKTKSNSFSNKGTALLISTLMTFSFSNASTLPSFLHSNTNTPEYISKSNSEVKKSFKERYNQISKSDWFLKNYKNMSIGDFISIDS